MTLEDRLDGNVLGIRVSGRRREVVHDVNGACVESYREPSPGRILSRAPVESYRQPR